MTFFHTGFCKKLLPLVLLFKLTQAPAQVPVHKEPRHHLVFENKGIRILNVLIPPGDTSLYHLHHTPSVFIMLTSTATGSQLLGGNPSSGTSTAGIIYFENLAPPHTRTHRVWNADQDTFHVMDIELLSEGKDFTQAPLALPGLSLVLDTTGIRAYRLSLLNGSGFMLPPGKQSFVLVSINTSGIQTIKNGKTREQAVKPGSFFVIKKAQSFTLKNISNDLAVFYLLEWPG